MKKISPTVKKAVRVALAAAAGAVAAWAVAKLLKPKKEAEEK